jgi:hypothetical protein
MFDRDYQKSMMRASTEGVERNKINRTLIALVVEGRDK